MLNTKYKTVISDWNQNIWKTCDAVIMAKTLKRLLLFNTLVCFKNWYWLSKHLEYFVEIFDSRPIFFRPPAPQRRVRRFRENFERTPQQRWAARSTPTAPSNFFFSPKECPSFWQIWMPLFFLFSHSHEQVNQLEFRKLRYGAEIHWKSEIKRET